MKITHIFERDLPLSSPGENAVVNFTGLKTSAVAIKSDLMRNGVPLIGYGFGSIGRWSVGGLLTERFFPRLMRANPSDLIDKEGIIDPARCWEIIMRNEKPGGHGERAVAVGAIDMALWDLRAKAFDVPLWKLLADTHNGGQYQRRVPVYAAGGYYQEGRDIESIKSEMRRYIDMGYTCTKMKVGGATLAQDMKRIEAAVSVLGSPQQLAVDANGRFTFEQALVWGREFDAMKLRWFEEPGDPLDYRLLANLAEEIHIPLATGENLFSSSETRNLLRYGGMRSDRDILQFDCALSYGLPDYLKTLQSLTAHGWSWQSVHPHGGHQMSLNLAAGLGLGGNESYPGVFQPLGGFADDIAVENGFVQMPDTPGIGLELKASLWKFLKELIP